MLTNRISAINNTQIDNAKDIDVRTLGSLWKYYGDEPVLTDPGVIANFLVIMFRLNLSKT